MPALSTHVAYGVFVCEPCRDEPEEDCGDSCAVPFADEMPYDLLDDYWPACRCCDRPASLVAPLVALA